VNQSIGEVSQDGTDSDEEYDNEQQPKLKSIRQTTHTDLVQNEEGDDFQDDDEFNKSHKSIKSIQD
jgi:hypothetical protein